MASFRLGALRDLFGRSDEPQVQAPAQEQAKEPTQAPTQAQEPVKQPAQERAKDLAKDLDRKVEEQQEKPVSRAARKPLEASDSYTAADIEVLEGLEPVRRRPGMYIGGTDEKALHHLFAEVI